jgi:ABC-2 type transport system ATP-binding protein
MHAVTLEQISKSYGKEKKLAVDDVSFTVEKGELFGLIGPDGAGKTSIFRMLTTLLLPDSGSATVDGFDIVRDYRSIRNNVGYMPGRFSMYQDLSIEENLDFFATVFGTTVKENYELIKDIYIQIEPFRKRRAGKLSGGMKQKLALCCALIHKPGVLFLDEPTTGVDPVSRKEFWEMLKRLKSQGITIVVSTPYMDEASLCDRIALIQNGRILSINSPAGIINSYPSKLYAIRAVNTYALLKDLRSWDNVSSCNAFGENLHITLRDDGLRAESGLLQYLEGKWHTEVRLKEVVPGIEDCFIALMNDRHE